ncbi:MAG TPA: hypothetical protein VGJ57_08445 [Nitrospirales bacterium]|jgi:uncharacterized protein YdeI (BOF family)
MKKLIGIMAVGCILSLSGWASAADTGTPGSTEMGAPGSTGGAAAAAEKAKEGANARTIKGEVLKIDGENYVVKDAAGKEVKLHVSSETKKEGDLKVGDKIEAQADASGHAISIKSAKSAR